MATRPYGMGPYGSSVYSAYRTVDIGGVAQISCGASGSMLRTWQQPTQMCATGTWQQPTQMCATGTWQQPTQMCATGTWTLTSLPSGPVNDQLELA